MLKKDDFSNNDDDFNLSDMINEYDEDDGLRKKIEAMKLEKAEEEARRAEGDAKHRAEAQLHSALLQPDGSEEQRNTFLDVDETQSDLGDTRIIDRSDVDKTLVIMENQRQRNYDENEEEESIYVYDNHEVDAEEITEEDIEEFLGDDKKVKKPRKQMDPNKMNKMITYGITGVVALCIIVASGFGIKMLMDSFGENKPAEKEPVDKEPIKDPIEKDPIQEKPTDNENKEPKDNSIRIAEIKGTIKALQDQVTQLTTSKATAEEELKKLEEELVPLSEQYAKDDTNYNNIVLKIQAAQNAKATSEAALAKDPENAKLKADVETATKEIQSLELAKEQTNTQREKSKAAADAKQKEKTSKAETRDGFVNQISAKQNEIQTLQTELSTLQ